MSSYNRNCRDVPKPIKIPVRRANLSRIDELAKPKQLPEGYIEDRRSVYWVDKLPPQPPTVFDVSPRLSKLVPYKKFHPLFESDRPSAVWPVSKAALNFPPEQEQYIILSRPKPFYKDFVPDREPPPYDVSRAALKYIATDRIVKLAIPKRRYAPPEFDFCAATWYDHPPVKQSALSYNSSERTELLSWPRSLPTGFEYDKSVMWKAPAGLNSVQASGRLAELSQPRQRMELYQGYDPYSVSSAARNAVATSRLDTLAQPRQFLGSTLGFW